MKPVVAIAHAFHHLGASARVLAWDDPKVARLSEEVRDGLRRWRGSEAAPPGACLIPVSPSQPFRPMPQAALDRALQLVRTRIDPELSAFRQYVSTILPSTPLSMAQTRTYAVKFREALLRGARLVSVPTGAVDRRIAAAVVAELLAVWSESETSLWAYWKAYPELLVPWRWFAVWCESVHGVGIICDWATRPGRFTSGGARGLRRRPLVDVSACVDLCLASAGQIPPDAGSRRGDLAIGAQRIKGRGVQVPTVRWRGPRKLLSTFDAGLVRRFQGDLGHLAASTRSNYVRVVIDLLKASGGLTADSTSLLCAWLALPPRRRSLARTAWAAFAASVESRGHLVGGEPTVYHPVRFLSADLARQAGLDLEFPWPPEPLAHLKVLVTELGPRFVHRLRARHLRVEGGAVVAVANPLRRTLCFEDIDPVVVLALSGWLGWAMSGPLVERWASVMPDWPLARIHPSYRVIASEALLRRLAGGVRSALDDSVEDGNVDAEIYSPRPIDE